MNNGYPAPVLIQPVNATVSGDVNFVVGTYLDRGSARKIVCEEWHRAVKEFNLKPGSDVEKVVARILERVTA